MKNATNPNGSSNGSGGLRPISEFVEPALDDIQAALLKHAESYFKAYLELKDLRKQRMGADQ